MGINGCDLLTLNQTYPNMSISSLDICRYGFTPCTSVLILKSIIIVCVCFIDLQEQDDC